MTDLQQDVVLEDALDWLEQVGTERKSVLEGGLLTAQ